MRLTVAIVVVVVTTLAGACGSGGTAATGPAVSPSTAVAASPTATPPAATRAPAISASAEATAVLEPTPMPAFTLTSTAFEPGTDIPARFTCDGADVSPPLAWSGAPAGTKSLVLIVTDPDARGFVHWVAYEIPGADSGSLPEAIPRSATSPKQGRNDFGKVGYGGPCPPSGTHHYVFQISAIDRTLGLDDGRQASEVEAAIKGHVLASTELAGTYQRS